MITSMKISGLFGIFNYKFNFNNEHIMILTGPNGYGKSTILNIINYVFCDHFIDVFRYEFKEIQFKIGKKTLTISKSKKGQLKYNKHVLPINCNEIDRINELYIEKKGTYNTIDELKAYIKRRINIDEDCKDLIDDDSFLPLVCYYFFSERYKYSSYNIIGKKINEFSNIKKDIDKIKKSVGKVYFIKEQRLVEEKIEFHYSGNKSLYNKTLIEISENLKNKLVDIQNRYIKESNYLDSTYISRLLSNNKPKYNAGELKSELKDISEKYKLLIEYGFAKEDISISKNWDKKYNDFRRELSIYIDDMKHKYSIAVEIIKKLNLYKEMINGMFAPFKYIDINLNDGISIFTDSGKKQLSLETLSSGEQEVLVLYYNLIFGLDSNLILIDEPEISLHVAWQRKFINDIYKIFELNLNANVIIATHSPQVIGGHLDIVEDLGDQYNVNI